MRHLHMLISDDLHRGLVEEAVKKKKARNKSELIRVLLESGLERCANGSEAPTIAGSNRAHANQLDLLYRLLELGVFAELALTEFLVKRPGLVDELKRRAKKALETTVRPSDRVPKAVQHKAAPRPPGPPEPESPDDLLKKDPRTMTKAERAAWKNALARELTGQNERT